MTTKSTSTNATNGIVQQTNPFPPSVGNAFSRGRHAHARRAAIDLPAETLDAFMAAAIRLHETNRDRESAQMCRCLLRADHRYWWVYSLYAAVLERLGRFDEALVQIDCGLRHEPGDPRLLALRGRIVNRLSCRATLPDPDANQDDVPPRALRRRRARERATRPDCGRSARSRR